jgi:hypothetical protein
MRDKLIIQIADNNNQRRKKKDTVTNSKDNKEKKWIEVEGKGLYSGEW